MKTKGKKQKNCQPNIRSMTNLRNAKNVLFSILKRYLFFYYCMV